MIKVENGKVGISGTHPEVMAELSTLVHELYFNVLPKHRNMTPDEAKAAINRAVEMGFCTEEQMCSKAVESFIETLLGALEKAAKNINHGKDDE